MAYPPTVPPNDRVNTTVMADNHPSDHNVAADALTDVVNELGDNPKGAYVDIEARLNALEAALDPIGTIRIAGRDTQGTGWIGTWLACNGAGLSTTTYADLFAEIGYAFGGSGPTFNLPNLRDAFPMGKGTEAIGVTGGSADAQLLKHDHGGATETDGTHVHDESANTAGNGYAARGLGDTEWGYVLDSNQPLFSYRQYPGVQAAGSEHDHGINEEGTADNGTDLNLPPYQRFEFFMRAT